MTDKNLLIGCIADDFSGASDAASFLAVQGLPTMLSNGIPRKEDISGYRALVIALKTRSALREEAIQKSLEAAKFLENQGTKLLYMKYCSTFDSTPNGNIGPIGDAVMEYIKTPYTLLCPSLPINGRIVNQGILYVDGVLLHESHMKDHPLNPMWDSDLRVLMSPQSKYPTFTLSQDMLKDGKKALDAFLEPLLTEHEHFYLVPDYVTDEDGERIAEYFGESPLLTGGSGLLAPLAKRTAYNVSSSGLKPIEGDERSIILAGSCSKATRSQIINFKLAGGYAIAIDTNKLLSKQQTAESLWEEAMKSGAKAMLFYSAGALNDEKPPSEQKHHSEWEEAARKMEQVLATLSQFAFDAGIKFILAAGGETSGAVIHALGFNSFKIGQSIAPGVPVMSPIQNPDIRVILKSGNFGQPDFFLRAIKMIGGRMP